MDNLNKTKQDKTIKTKKHTNNNKKPTTTHLKQRHLFCKRQQKEYKSLDSQGAYNTLEVLPCKMNRKQVKFVLTLNYNQHLALEVFIQPKFHISLGTTLLALGFKRQAANGKYQAWRFKWNSGWGKVGWSMIFTDLFFLDIKITFKIYLLGL